MEYYVGIFTFTFVAGITPGPNNIMLLASGLNHGIKKSLPHYLGICFGFPLMVAAIGFGLGVFFERYPQLHNIIKTLGICYLLYLAWKIAVSNTINENNTIKQPISFIQAALFQWLNPKAWVIAIGAISAFTIQSNITQSILFIIISYLITALITMGIWLGFGVTLQSLLNNDKRKQGFNICMASLLVLSIIPMILNI